MQKQAPTKSLNVLANTSDLALLIPRTQELPELNQQKTDNSTSFSTNMKEKVRSRPGTNLLERPNVLARMGLL